MSGHSKWATTKRQKAIVDAKRGAAFTKIANQIAIAARSGGDPTMNPTLAMVLEKARKANMPKANIERAIARATDKSAAAMIEETYEAYGQLESELLLKLQPTTRIEPCQKYAMLYLKMVDAWLTLEA